MQVDCEQQETHFVMPLSLQYIKESASQKLSFDIIKNFHFYDLQSLLVSLRITDIKRYLDMQKNSELQKNGINSVKKISGSAIDKLF